MPAYVGMNYTWVDSPPYYPGNTYNALLTLSNNGDVPPPLFPWSSCAVSKTGPTLNDPSGQFQLATYDAYQFTNLPQGYGLQFPFFFKPTKIGVFTATITWDFYTSILPNGNPDLSTDQQCVLTITAEAVAGGAASFTVVPSVLTFPLTQIGVTSGSQKITATNTSPAGVFITLSSATLVDQFAFSSGDISSPVVLAPGEAHVFEVTFTPLTEGLVLETHGFTLISDSPTSPDYVELRASDYIIIPVEPLVEGQDKTCVLCFNNTGVNTAWEFDSNDLNCEEVAFLKKLLNFEMIGIDKSLDRVFFKYEDLGPGTVSVQGRTRQPPNVNQVQMSDVDYGTSVKDSYPLQSLSDYIPVDGEMIEVTLYKDKSTGPLSLVELVYKFFTGSKLIGSSGYSRNIASYAKLQGLEACLFSFNDGEVAQANVNDLECEEEQLLCKLYDLSQSTTESALFKTSFKYEDKGPSSLELRVGTKRQDLPVVTVTYGTIERLNRVLQAFGDLEINDEVIRVGIHKNANSGPLSLIELNQFFTPTGEVVENT